MTDVSNTPKRPSKQACGRCGKDPAAGFATVDGIRYCHGDFEPDPTCYMLAQRVGLYLGVDGDPFSGEPGTSTSAGGSWGNS